MGVPRLAPWLRSRYPSIVKASIHDINAAGLYIDVNGVIHPFCHGPNIDALPESEKIENILSHIEHLVMIVRPTQLLYLAVDGVAPRAKMNQQRARRYMSTAYDKSCVEDSTAQMLFDSNAISPGTTFMDRVTKAIEKFIQEKLSSSDEVWNGLAIFLSDSNVPSEGEHKLIRFLRSQTGSSKFVPTGAHVIVGLDADLVFLSLSLHIPRVLLMRDLRDARGKETQLFEYFDVDELGTSLVSEVYRLSLIKGFQRKCPVSAYCRVSSSGYQFPLPYDLRHPETEAAIKSSFHPCTATFNCKIVEDFIVMATFVGNDFMPRLPSAYAGEAALDHILECYIDDVLPYGFLTAGEGEVNPHQLARLFKSYSFVEEYLFVYGENPELTKTAEVRRQRFSDLQQVYYKSVGMTGSTLQEACSDYIRTLRFVWQYYSRLDEVDWKWFYPHHHSPMAVDLYYYLSKNLFTTPYKSLLSSDNKPCDKFVQLLSILPPTSQDLVPKICRPFFRPSEKNKHVALEWKVDFTGAFTELHLTAVMLPFAEMKKLEEQFSEIKPKLSKEEQALNENQKYHRLYYAAAQKKKFRYLVGKRHRPKKEGEDVYCEEFLEKPPAIFPRPRMYSYQATINHFYHEAVALNKSSVSHLMHLPDLATAGCVLLSLYTFWQVGLHPFRLFLPLFQVLSLFVLVMLGIYLFDLVVPSPEAQRGIRRYKDRRVFVNWVCRQCGAGNFERQWNKCFFCSAPCDRRRCRVMFTSKCPQDALQLWKADHSVFYKTYKTGKVVFGVQEENDI